MTISFPLQILFQNLSPSEAIAHNIMTRALKLVRYYEHILDCQVVLSIDNRHPHQGKLFNTCIELTIPHKKFVASKGPHQNHSHEDAFVSIRDAFKAIQRQLQDYIHIQQGKIKHHIVPAHGRIARLASHANYGFIESSDGQNVYFTSNSIVFGDFKKLHIGDSVRFVAAANEMHGLSASTVRVIGKHHVA